MLYGAMEWAPRAMLAKRWNKNPLVACLVSILKDFSEKKSGLGNFLKS